MKKIITYKGYFADFVEKLSKDEMNKVRRALDLFKVEDKVPRHFIKFIRDGVYEFRVNYGNNEFRIFFIYDGDTIVVLFNAFKKKTQKTPESEIKKAIKFAHCIPPKPFHGFFHALKYLLYPDLHPTKHPSHKYPY